MTTITQPRFRRQSKQVTDSYQNLNERMGIGADNAANSGRYVLNPITRNRGHLDAMYRGSWIIGKAVDTIADDMVKRGIDFTGDAKPKDIGALKRTFAKTQVWGSLGDAVRWSRLYGGSIAVMMIDGQDVASELRIDSVAKGQFRGLAICDRWMVLPSFEIVTEFGPHFGKPMFYRVYAPNHPLSGKVVHYTRCLRFEGLNLPHLQKQSELGWGLSVVERIFDRLLAFDSATQGSAQLVFKAYLRTVKVEGLRQILAAGGEAYEALLSQMENIRRFQSIEGMTMIDAKDDWQSTSYTFAGLDDVLMQFGQQLSGALEIPLVRLFGQSPAGLNSTGESDLKTYFDAIGQQQENALREPLELLTTVIHRSTFNSDKPEEMDFTFNPLGELSEVEKAEIAERTSNAVRNMYDSGIIERDVALKELRQSSDTTGIFTNITDEMITEAENEEPPEPELETPNVLGLPSPPPNGPEGNKPPVPPGEEG